MTEINVESKPAAALLSDTQIKHLRTSIIVMSVLLVIGVITLIARVIYLVSGRSEQAATTTMANTSAPVMADIKLQLPPGASLKTSSLQGTRLLAHYSGPAGDGLLILDLSTGKTLSHVRFEAMR
jgi:hypothetical protein